MADFIKDNLPGGIKGAIVDSQSGLSEKDIQKDSQLKALNIIAYATDISFKPQYYMGAVKEITGYDETDLLSDQIKWEYLVHPEDLANFQAGHDDLLTTRKAQKMEYRIISGEGELLWLNDMAVPVLDKAGQVASIEGLCMDITVRKKTEVELLDRQAHLDSILNSVQDVIWSVTPDTFELLYISPSAEKVYGYPLGKLYEDAADGYRIMHTSHELMLENFATLLQRGWFEAEYSIVLPHGEKRWLHRRAHFAHDAHGFVARIDGVDVDITRRKEAEDSLRYVSMHDCLTGLFNRFYFEKEMVAIENSSLGAVGLIVCDIDGLKLINDNLGHEAGDQLLKKCSGILTNCFNNDEIVSRIGGDEFTIIIKNCSAQRLEAAVAKLRQAVEEQNRSECQYPLSVSIGQALKPSPEISVREVFRQADNMMYAEKPEKHRSFHKLYRSLKL